MKFSTSYIHETAMIDDGAELGFGNKVWHWVHICSGAKIGSENSLGQNVFVGDGAVIGNNSKIQNNVSIYGSVLLEDFVFCGPSMVFTNVINPRSEIPRKEQYLSTLVRRGATLGANSTIVCGNTINRYAFVGAGAVVTKDVPAFAIMVGVPARRVGWMCQCGEKLPEGDELECIVCGSQYHVSGETCLKLGG